MSKYIDLAQTIRNDGIEAYYDEIVAVLCWLDNHPNRVPARTIAAGEVGRWSHLIRGDVEIPSIIDFLDAVGMTVVPDPEPTNKERLKAILDGFMGDDVGICTEIAVYLDGNGVTAPNSKDN